MRAWGRGADSFAWEGFMEQVIAKLDLEGQVCEKVLLMCSFSSFSVASVFQHHHIVYLLQEAFSEKYLSSSQVPASPLHSFCPTVFLVSAVIFHQVLASCSCHPASPVAS